MSRLAPETETNAAVHIHNTSDTRWLRGWLAQIPPRPTRPTTPIPNSKSAAAAARGPSVSPPPSDVGGAKQLSQYFWLRRGRGWRLQIAIFNMLLQPEGGREAGCIFCFRVTVARRRGEEQSRKSSAVSSLKPTSGRPVGRRLTESEKRRPPLAASSALSLLLFFLLQFPVYTKERRSRSVQSRSRSVPCRSAGRPVVILDT